MNSHRESGYRPYPTYKDSGVEWLGEVPGHWGVTPLKAILERNDSGVWGEDTDVEGTIVLRSTEQTVDGQWRIENPAIRKLTSREAAEGLLRERDLVLTKSSGSELHIGKTTIVDDVVASMNAAFSNFMQRLRVRNSGAPRFFWYLLNSIVTREQFGYFSTTTTGLGNLNGKIIGNLLTPLPPLPEQHAIAAFLDHKTAEIDALIAAKERLIALLREKRAALITSAVTKGLDPDVAMKDSGVEWLGEVPGHWEVKKIKHLAHLKSGEGITANDIEVSGQYAVFGGNGIRGYTDLFTHDGSFVLIGRQGALCGNINYAHGRFWASEHAVVARPLKPYDVLWFGELLRSMDLNQYSVSAAQPGLAVERVANLAIPVPPLSEQHEIAFYLKTEIDRIENVIIKATDAISYLQEYRTALISAAVTGKIDVREGVTAAYDK